MTHDPELQAAAVRERQVIVFGLAIIVTYLLAAFIPDLVPPAAHAHLAEFAHARVISVEPAGASPLDQASGAVPPDQASDTGQPGASDVPLPSDDGSGSGQDGAGSGDGGGVAPPTATVLYLDGPLAGQQGQGLVQGPSGALELPDYRPGDEVVVEIDSAPDGSQSATLVDRWRIPLFGVLVGGLTVLAAGVAGWRGLRSIASLALTLVLVLRLFVPLVILGWNAVALAVVFGIVVTVLSFMLTQGITRTTLSAIAGTTIGLAITGVIAAVVTGAAQFTPAQGSDEVVYLQQVTGGTIDLSGLLLAAVIFGGLGVLNDVAISQATTLEELHRADASLRRGQLFLRTMNVGTAHLAANINTLVFAYLGTALPLVVLLVLQASNSSAAVSLEGVAVEITRTLVGAIGILAAVPITTAIAARWVARYPVRRGRTQAGEPTA